MKIPAAEEHYVIHDRGRGKHLRAADQWAEHFAYSPTGALGNLNEVTSAGRDEHVIGHSPRNTGRDKGWTGDQFRRCQFYLHRTSANLRSAVCEVHVAVLTGVSYPLALGICTDALGCRASGQQNGAGPKVIICIVIGNRIKESYDGARA